MRRSTGQSKTTPRRALFAAHRTILRHAASDPQFVSHDFHLLATLGDHAGNGEHCGVTLGRQDRLVSLGKRIT